MRRKALTEVVNVIDKLVPQCQKSYQNEDNKINLLRSAVKMRPWAAIPMIKVDAGKATCRQFTIDLHAAFWLQIEIKSEQDNYTHFIRDKDSRTSDCDATYLTRFGRDPMFIQTKKNSFNPTNPSQSHSQRLNLNTLYRISRYTSNALMTFEEARK